MRDRGEGLVRTFRDLAGRRSTAAALVVAGLLFAGMVGAQLASLPLVVHFSEGHNWRETFTYGVAWNYAHGDITDVLHPRMLVFHAKSNVVPMEPPLYPWLCSLLLRVGGDSVVGPRLLSLAGLVTTVVVLWRWLGEASRARRADDAGWEEKAGLLLALALAPAVAVEFRQMQPEATCAGLAIGAAYFAERYARSDALGDAARAVLLAALSVLVKPVALGVLPGVLAFGAWGPLTEGRWRGVVRRTLVLGGGLAVALVPYVAWDRWSHHLQQVEMDGAFFIAIEHDPKVMLRNVLTMKYAREALFFFLPSYASATWLVPAVVAGVHRSLASRELRRYAGPFVVWLLFYMVELLAVGDRLHSNAYYFTLAPAPMAYFAAVGFGAVVRVLGTPGRKPLALFQSGLLAAVLLAASAFMVKNWRWSNTVDLAALGVEKNRNMWGDDIGIARLLVAVVVLFALAPLLRPRRIPEPLGLVLVSTILGSGAWAARDRAQYFRYYVAADKRATFADEVRELREVVARRSRREDLVVTTPGWSAQSPNMLLFFLAMRNGLPITTGQDLLDVTAAKARGAKLYLRVDLPGEGDVPPIPGVPLAARAWWRLTCIADDGCPEVR